MAKIKTVESFDETKPAIQTVNFNGVEKPIVFDLSRLCDEPGFFDEIVERAPMIARLAWHGNRRKTCDAHASLGEAGPAACVAATTDVWENLVNGVWEDRDTGGWLVDALVAVTGRERDDCVAAVRAADAKTRRETMKNPAIAKWKAERDLERLAARDDDGGDLSTLF